MNPLLMNYLMGQSDLGLDEVILPNPIKIYKGDKTESQNKVLNNEAVPGKFSRSLFGELAKSLEVDQVITKVDMGLSHKPQIQTEAFTLPELSNLSEHWKYLSENGPKFFELSKQSILNIGVGPINAPLAVVTYQPREVHGNGVQAFSLEAQELLKKMMKAIRFDLELLYQTSLIKFSEVTRMPSRRDYNRILPLLYQELKIAQVPVVLLLGEACAQAVLKTGKSIDELRQIPSRENGREFVVTYHPEDLLKREELKRKTWDDLQWLQKRMLEAQADR